MTSGQKIAFSLLAALALFAVLVMSLHSMLFDELETRFYAQAKIEENTGQLDQISESCDSYISEILVFIEKGDNAWTKNAAVRSYYVQNPSESELNQRRHLTENLFEQIPALSGIRIVDKNGRNVHYSSFDDTDLLKQNGISKIYKNYTDIIKDAGEISFEDLQKNSSETKSVLLCDESRGRLILSVPFCWVDGIYSGMALFYLNLSEVENELVRRDVISMGQGLTLFSDDDFNGGFVFGLPRTGKAEFRSPFLTYWKARSQVMRGGDERQQPEKLLALPDGRYYVSLSSNRIGKIRVSAVYTSDVFELSAEIRILIYISIFISILLVVFLIFSFIRDPMVTLQKRVKKIQLEIIEDYIDGKEKREWGDLARHLRLRKNDLSDDIIKSLHLHSKKRRKELAEYLDKNWDEIFAIFDTKTGGEGKNAAAAGTAGAAELTGASIAEIRRMLEEVLQNKNIVLPAAGAAVAGAAAVKAAASKKVESVDQVEELDDVEELAEDAEELDEVEELTEDAEELDEVEELAEEAEEVDEVEELAEDAEEVEELAEDVEEAEEVDEVEELAEDVEDAEEAEEVDEVEELAEDSEDAEEIEEVEELAEDAEEIDEVEELSEEAEEAEEVEELAEEVETLDEPVEELEEEVEELDELEEVEELEGAEESDNVDAYLKSIQPPKVDYAPSNDTFFKTENFANVENLFAEELKLGDFAPYHLKDSKPIQITVYPLPVYGPVEEVEELTEEIPSYLPEPDFSMTSFGDNLSADVPELEAENVIIEEDGVFSIASNLEYTDVPQDATFKSLVDSVL